MRIEQLFENTKRYRYVFHVAPVSALPNIRRKGLIPSTGNWERIKYAPTIFVVASNTTDVIDDVMTMMLGREKDHDAWSEEQWQQFYDSYVLLTIDLSKCSNVKMVPDPHADSSMESYMLSGVVPPESIVAVDGIDPHS